MPQSFTFEEAMKPAKNSVNNSFTFEEAMAAPKQSNSWSKAMRERGADLADVVDRYKTGQQTLLETLVQGAVKGTIGTGYDVLGQGLSQVANLPASPFDLTGPSIKDKFKPVAEYIAQQPIVQKAGEEFSKLSPRQQANLETVGLLPLGAIGKAGASAVKPLARDFGTAVNKAAYNVGEKLEKNAIIEAQDIIQKSAQERILPKESKKVLEEQEARMVPIKEGSNKFKYEPTDIEKEMADKLVSIGYKTNEPLKRTRYNVDQAKIKEAENLKSILQSKDINFSKDEINGSLQNVVNKLNEMPSLRNEEGKLSSVASGFIDRAQNIFNKYTTKYPSGEVISPANLLEARKEFDDLFKSEYGQMAFDSDRATSAKVAVDTIRQEMNNLIDAKVPDVGVKDSLRKQYILYQIEDNLIPKSAVTKKTPIGRGFQKVAEVSKKREKLIQGSALLFATTSLGAAAYFSGPAAVLIAASGGIKAFQKLILKNPKLKSFAGKTLKSLGEKGDFSALSPVEIKTLQNEIKLLTAPEKAANAPSAEKVAANKPLRITIPTKTSYEDARKLAIQELQVENPLIFETKTGNSKARKELIDKKAFEILKRIEREQRRAQFNAIPSQDKRPLK